VHARSEIGGSEREVRALNEIRDSNELSAEGQAKTQSDMYSRAQKVYSMYSNVSYCPVPVRKQG
jgi:hypothetical protein